MSDFDHNIKVLFVVMVVGFALQISGIAGMIYNVHYINQLGDDIDSAASTEELDEIHDDIRFHGRLNILFGGILFAGLALFQIGFKYHRTLMCH